MALPRRTRQRQLLQAQKEHGGMLLKEEAAIRRAQSAR